MGFVKLMRVLWRRRVAVFVGLVAAIAIGVVVAAVAGWLALRWWRRRRQERAVAGISVVSEHAG